jgi:hypothetical protein
VSRLKIHSIELGDEQRGHKITGRLLYGTEHERTEIFYEGFLTPAEKSELDTVLEKVSQRISGTMKNEIPHRLL